MRTVRFFHSSLPSCLAFPPMIEVTETSAKFELSNYKIDEYADYFELQFSFEVIKPVTNG